MNNKNFPELHRNQLVYLKRDFDYINGKWKLIPGRVKRKYYCVELLLYFPRSGKIIEAWNLESDNKDITLLAQTPDELITYAQMGE